MKIYIIGAGPGDPDLITVKGLNILQTADVILYTDSLVNEELIAKAKPEAEVLKTAGMHLEEIVDIMVDRVKAGKMVATCPYRGSCHVRCNHGTNCSFEERGYWL